MSVTVVDFPINDPYRVKPSNGQGCTQIQDNHNHRNEGDISDLGLENMCAHPYLPYSNCAPDVHSPVEFCHDDPHLQLDLFNANGHCRSMLSAPSLSFIQKQHVTSTIDPSTSVAPGVSPTLLSRGYPNGLSSPTAFSSIDFLRRRRRRRKCLFFFDYPSRHDDHCPRWSCYVIAGLALTLLVVGVILYFCWPRIPAVLMDDHAQSIYLPTDWGPDDYPWLRATWQLNVTLDNTQNWIPTRLQNLEWRMADDETGVIFAIAHATDSPTEVVLSPKTAQSLRIVLHVSYESSSGMNDTTFQHLYNACGPKKMGAPSELKVHLQVTISVWGIIWTQTAVARPATGTFLCPTT